MANATSSPATFPLFPRLPKEIRLQIWELALPGARIVELTCTTNKHPIWGDPEISWVWTTDVASPPHLYVNLEARDTALRSYDPVDVWECTSFPSGRTFVDYSKDMFFFHEEDFMDLLDDLNPKIASLAAPAIRLDKTQHLAVSANCHEEWCDGFIGVSRHPDGIKSAQRYLGAILNAFTGLKKLVFVLDEGGYESEDDFREIMDAEAEWDDDNWRFHWPTPISSPFSLLRRQCAYLNIPTVQIRRSIDGVKPEIQFVT